MEQAKVKTGIGALDIVALTFAAVGGIFTAVALIILININNITVTGTDNPYIFPIVFGSIGLPLLILGVIFGAVSLRKRSVIKRIVSEGYYVTADVVNISQNFSVSVNGSCPYVLECHYRDPATGRLCIFHSRNIFFYPAELLNRQVRVYTDRNDMRKYYVDVDGSVSDFRP